MVIRRCVILVESPFSARDFRRFGVQEFLDAGIAVDVWDLSSFLLPGSRKQWIANPGFEYVHQVLSLEELRARLADLNSEDLLVTYVGCGVAEARRSLRLQRAWSSCKARVATVSAMRTLGISPGAGTPSRSRALLHSPVRWLTTTDSDLGRVLRAAARPLLRIRPLDVIWCPTTHVDINRLLVSGRTRIVGIHTFDYDLLLERLEINSGTAPTAVLLDTMGPLHPDFVTLGGTYWEMSADEYFALLRAQLAALEGALAMKVLVAAHPRAEPGTLDEAYEGFQVVHGQTAQLIRSATVVLGVNASTSLGMAVALNKPVLLLESSRWPEPVHVGLVRFKEAIKAQVWNTDAEPAPHYVRELNPDAREQFIADFMKVPGTPEEPFWRVAISSLA